jgi:FkbM family methyltransferase
MRILRLLLLNLSGIVRKFLVRRPPKTDIDLDKPWTQTFSPVVTKLDVYYFFRHILGRLPSESEWAGHCGFVGKELTDVVSVYLASDEYKRRQLVGFAPRDIQCVQLDGYVMYAASNDYAVGNAVITGRTYEPGVSAVFRRCLQPGMTVIDIGANIGWFTWLSAHLVGASGRVFAFEPDQINGRFLVLSRAANHFQQVTLIHAAASDSIGSLAYNAAFSNGVVSDLTRSTPEEMLEADIVLSIPVDSMIPDDLPVHLIKVDVEGWEMKALNGATRTIERWKPRIVAEFTPPALQGYSGVTGEEFLNALIRRGYSVSVIHRERLVPCGQNISAVMDEYTEAKSSHIDILCQIE